MAIFRGTGSAATTSDQTTIDTVTQAVVDAEAAQTAAETAQGLAETAKTNAENLYGDLAAVEAAKNTAVASASTATTKASEAAASAVSASDDATNANASYILTNGAFLDFQTLFLGTKTVAGGDTIPPVVDNQGNALRDGALYFNGDSNFLFVYNEGDEEWINVTPSETVTLSQVSDVTANANEVNILDVSAQTPSDGQVLTYNTVGDLNWATPSTETNDLTASVTWANVPDANITESSVTQHEAALTITESQISDLQSYLTDYTVTEGDVTAHQAALSITESQISDLGGDIVLNSDIGSTVQAYDADNAVLDDDQTFTGDITFTGTSKVQQTKEKMTISATAATGTINYDALTQSVLYYTSDASANWTVNVRGDGSNTLNSIMSTGEALTVVFLVTQGATAYYNSAFQVDGSSVTPKWQGGSAPTEGTASGIDAYTYNIIKTADATFTVLASIADFA